MKCSTVLGGEKADLFRGLHVRYGGAENACTSSTDRSGEDDRGGAICFRNGAPSGEKGDKLSFLALEEAMEA